MKQLNREDHPLYSTWKSMLSRCNNPNVKSYPHYGGRGIKVCDRWAEDYFGFLNFVTDMGTRPEGTTLDREDNDGDYYKDNCRWATQEDQSTNRSDNVYIKYLGEVLTESQFSKKYGVKRTTLQARRNKGYTPEELIFGKERRRYLVEGKRCNQKELAEFLSISPQLLNIRLVKKGRTLQEVLDEFT